MANNTDVETVVVFVPALAAVLLNAEDSKGSPLDYDEVIEIRNGAACMQAPPDVAEKLLAERGPDIDPENCWYDWQMLRRELGRLPEIDPGPQFRPLDTGDPEYLEAVDTAQRTLDDFRARLPADETPLGHALIKTRLTDGDQAELLWLSATRRSGPDFIAQVFEAPKTLPNFPVRTPVQVSSGSVLDWMINDDGALSGGFSLRYHRARLPEDERPGFDEYVGVETYL
ncbi:MAG: DUF2314 domain-containing protein [Acidobacteriota bacterium]